MAGVLPQQKLEVWPARPRAQMSNLLQLYEPGQVSHYGPNMFADYTYLLWQMT